MNLVPDYKTRKCWPTQIQNIKTEDDNSQQDFFSSFLFFCIMGFEAPGGHALSQCVAL